MSNDTELEPFPATEPVARPALLHQDSRTSVTTRLTRRRTSSSLPGDPRGDTGGSSISTYTDLPAPQDAPLSPALKSQDRRSSKRRKARSLFQRWKNISLRHTWLNPLIVVLIVLSLYALNPSTSNPLHHCIFLSYPLARNDPLAADNYMRPYWKDTTQYGKGRLDIAFVGFYTIVLSFTREFLMQRAIRPFVLWLGIKSRAKQARFMEQAYTAIYFGIFGPYGLYVMSRSPVWYFNTTAMFEDFPHRAHEGLFKAYYLLQASYWAQQAIVLMLQLEKPRKDFKELVAHHIITLALIGLSYRFHFTYMGIAVYITHDVSDFFLATSKMLNYVDSIIIVPYFGAFVGIWAYCRHYLNLRILYATATEFRTVGPWELNWETQQYKCYISQPITFGLLAALQGVNLFWFFLILRILKNVIFYDIQADERSEYDDDEDADETTAEKRERMGLPAAPPTEEELASPPAASTRSKARVNGHASTPSLQVNDEDVEDSDTPSKATGADGGKGSRRRRKA